MHNQFNLVNKNKGVKILNARVWAGWDKGIYLKKSAARREAGKSGRAKRKGVWGKEFLPACRKPKTFFRTAAGPQIGRWVGLEILCLYIFFNLAQIR